MTLRNHNNKDSSSADGQRHGSTGAESTRSNDTVRGPFSSSFSSVRGAPLKLHTKRQKYVFRFRMWYREGVSGHARNEWASGSLAGASCKVEAE